MTFATCPDCKSRRIVVQPGTNQARIRLHQATDSSTRTLRTCPGSGTRPTMTQEA